MLHGRGAGVSVTVRDWVIVVATLGGWVFVVALAVDKWVHQQGKNDITIAAKVEAIHARIATNADHILAINKLVEEGNTRSSTKMTEINKKIGEIELDLTRLKTIEEYAQRQASDLRRFNREHTDG